MTLRLRTSYSESGCVFLRHGLSVSDHPNVTEPQKKRKNLVPYGEYIQDRKLWEEDRYTRICILRSWNFPQELKGPTWRTLLSGQLFSREVSDILQMKEGTVKSRLSRRENSSECSLESRGAYYAREGKMGACGAGGYKEFNVKFEAGFWGTGQKKKPEK